VGVVLLWRYKEPPRNSRGDMFVDVDKSMGCRGSKKLQLYPTNLTHPTPIMLYKALRYMTGVGFVECVD
jgi:hypothetical protein